MIADEHVYYGTGTGDTERLTARMVIAAQEFTISPGMAMPSMPPSPPPIPKVAPPPEERIPGKGGKICDEPLLYITKNLAEWVDKNAKGSGKVLLFGKLKGDKLTSSAIKLVSNGGCDDINQINSDNILSTISILAGVNTIPTALCIVRSHPPSLESVCMRNIMKFTEEYIDLACIIYTQTVQLVWKIKGKTLYRSLLGSK